MRGQGRRVVYTPADLDAIRVLRAEGGFVELLAKESRASPWTVNRVINHEHRVLEATWALLGPHIRRQAKKLRGRLVKIGLAPEATMRQQAGQGDQ